MDSTGACGAPNAGSNPAGPAFISSRNMKKKKGKKQEEDMATTTFTEGHVGEHEADDEANSDAS